MMLPEGENGLLLTDQQIQDLREARNKMRLPKSLSSLAIRSVTTHLTRFVGVPDSPLKFLPNTIVQQLLSKIAKNLKKEKIQDMPLSLLKEVLGLLMNPNVTEFDCTVFGYPFRENNTLSIYLIEHALKNCPKIRKIKFPDEGKFFASFRNSLMYLTPLICRSEGFCTKDTMAFLQENFPNIEELAVSIHILDGPTAQAMLDHLINMKKLHTLNLLYVVSVDIDLIKSVVPEFIADVAGAVPSLQNFSYSYGGMNANKFIDLFGEKYPHKKLCVDKLGIDDGLKRKWPKNLTVNRLKINCDRREMSDTEIENLRTLDFTHDLTMEYGPVQQIYKVLDCIGGLVKSLTIVKTSLDSSIILERGLAACPNLEHFKFLRPRSVIEDPNYSMSPAAFKNYKSLDVLEDEYSSEVVLQQVFQKFLIGTQVCELLKLYHYNQLQALVQFAFAYPESLQQLRELHFTPRRSLNFYTRDQMNEDLLKYDKCFYELLTCCHKLKRIIFYIFQTVKEGKQENRYTITIKSIDPHFIKYSRYMNEGRATSGVGLCYSQTDVIG